MPHVLPLVAGDTRVAHRLHRGLEDVLRHDARPHHVDRRLLPGLGRLMVDSILSRDYPVVQGCLLFTALSYVVINLIVDLCYPLFDPRVTAA